MLIKVWGIGRCWNRSMEMELKKLQKPKELQKPIVEEISTKREPMEKCAWNRKEIQQEATTYNKQCKEEKQVEELLHEISNEKRTREMCELPCYIYYV